jgi:hypothetical protein
MKTFAEMGGPHGGCRPPLGLWNGRVCLSARHLTAAVCLCACV